MPHTSYCARSHGARRLCPVLLACLALETQNRPLPDKNELANACYFTYRVGYIICDSGLEPDDAQSQYEAGKCNEDFRLMASDFQRRMVQHYMASGPPPLEEAAWMLNAPEHFQERTLKECAAMQVMAALLLAESKLYLDGPSEVGPAGQMMYVALQQATNVEQEVYTALARAWPMEVAINRYQNTAYTLRKRIADRFEPEAYGIKMVVCRCSESLDWLIELVPRNLAVKLNIYETCPGAALGVALGVAFSEVLAIRADPDARGVRSECSAGLVLRHLSSELLAGAASSSSATAFLPAASPEEQERSLLSLVLQSVGQGTFDAAFVPLAMQRGLPRSASGFSCHRAVWREGLGLQGVPSGYEGARFVVSALHLQAHSTMVARLVQTLETHHERCSFEGAESFGNSLDFAWHAVFGGAALQPLRADDASLPMFLRFADGPSGFWKTRLPKASSYLASVGASMVSQAS